MTVHDAHDTQKILFAGLPRRRRLGGPVVVGLWLVLAIAFLTDAVPTQPSAEWLYDLEARRADYARTFAAEQRAGAAQAGAAARRAGVAEEARAASRQARLPPGKTRDHPSLAPAALAADVARARAPARTPCGVE